MHSFNTLISQLFAPHKGIIAADDRPESMDKRLSQFNIEANKQNRTRYREIVVTTPGIERFISGIIFSEETLLDPLSDGRRFNDVLNSRGMIVGVKVDEGLAPYQNSPIEKISIGLDSLEKKLINYKKHGAQFCKWRSVFTISNTCPSIDCIVENCKILSVYAKIALKNGFVPILEPEVLMDGDHNIERCHFVTAQVLRHLFETLQKESVNTTNIILKCNMILSGHDAKIKASPQEVARHTIEVLSTSAPHNVGGVVFLSGGQSTLEAMLNLNEIVKINPLPYPVSFCFDRVFMSPVLQSWQGHEQNIEKAQKELLAVVKNVSQAENGKFTT